MALWDKLKTELDRAGRAAQTAFDEGKVRLEILRVRQLADKAAQALGYAVHNARKSGGNLDDDTYSRLSGTLAAHEAEVARLEAQLAAERASSGVDADVGGTASGDPSSASGSASTSEPYAGDQGGGDTGSASRSTPPFSGPAQPPQGGVDPASGDAGGSRPSGF